MNATPSRVISTITPALLLPGAAALEEEEKGVNEVYRGPIEGDFGKTIAYVKLLDVKQLINELVASVLGRTLGLQLPRPFIVLVELEDYPQSMFLRNAGVPKVLAFGVESIGHPDLKRRIRADGEGVVDALLHAWTGWCDAMVFDEWIANSDRNSGNLLVGAPGEVWLIDHGLAFTGGDWQPAGLDPRIAVHNEIAKAVAPRLGLPGRYQALKRATEIAQECRTISPDEVIREGFVAAFASSEEIGALRGFIGARVDELVRLTSGRLGVPVLEARSE